MSEESVTTIATRAAAILAGIPQASDARPKPARDDRAERRAWRPGLNDGTLNGESR
jgi:hypothetical protein